MAQLKLNLYRQITHVILLTFSISISTVNSQAQHSNGTHDNQYEIYTNFNPTIALVIVVLVCAFFLLGVFSMFIRQCSEPETSAAPSAVVVPNLLTAGTNSSGLDPAVIEKLFPVFFYSDVKPVKIGRETLECAICLSEFEDDETLRLLPKCNHVFHPDCIDEWLASHVTCPVCRCILAPESDEIPKFSLPDTAVPSTDPDLNHSLNEVAITVNHEEPNSDSAASIITNRNRRSTISGRFSRSHSTGHSLANIERYTLRLPEGVRTQIMANAKLKRTLSFNVISTKEWSVIRREYKIGGEGSSRGKQIGWSERWSILINSGVNSDSVNSRKLLTAVKLNCLSLRVEGVEQALPV